MATEKFDLSVILRFIDKATPGMQKFGKQMSRIGKKMRDVGKTMSVAVTAPIVAFGANAIRIGSDFQKTMNMVGAVTSSTGETFNKLKATARDLGSTTQFSARQAGEAMRFMGMAGFDANKIIAASPKVLELAAAAQLDMGSAANITTNIMAGFGFQAKDMTRVNDILVNTFTNSNVNLTNMGEALKKVGPVASKMGFRFTEVSAALGIMGNAGIQGSEAGVALRRALINLQKPSKQSQEAMRFMELQFNNTDGSVKDLTGVIAEYENAVKKGATETQVITSMMQIFGPRAVAPMLALLEEGSKGMSKMEEKTKKVGTASEIARRQMEGLPGALKLVTSAWEGVNIALTEGEFGTWVEDTARSLAKLLGKIGQFIKTNPEMTKWIVAITAGFAVGGPLLVGLGFVAIAIGALLSPVGLVVAGIAALAAGAALIIANWEPIKKFFEDLWEDAFMRPLRLVQQQWEAFLVFIGAKKGGTEVAAGGVAGFKAAQKANTAKLKQEGITDTGIQAGLAAQGKTSSSSRFGETEIERLIRTRGAETKVVIELESKDGSSATVKSVDKKGLSDVRITNRANVGLTAPNIATIGF